MRYFAEHGATVVRVESRSRPDFLRTYGMGPGNPCGLEGSDMFDALNVGKLSITLNLKHPEGVALAKRLVHWADAVAENFAPRAMRSFGLDYASMVTEKPDLVMVSSCLQGQTGPHKDYPGFGGQGSALGGYNLLTGWPDREPVGPYGTITDSLAPRFVASALAAGLLYRRRTGRGVHLDVSQVEAAVYSLTPWVLDYDVNGHVGSRQGNRSDRAVPHGAFACAGEDRWVAIAVWDDGDWERLARALGLDADTTRRFATFEARAAAIDDVEALVSAWTASRPPARWRPPCRARGSKPCPWPTSATPRRTPSSITATTSSPWSTPAWASAATSATASVSATRRPASPGRAPPWASTTTTSWATSWDWALRSANASSTTACSSSAPPTTSPQGAGAPVPPALVGVPARGPAPDPVGEDARGRRGQATEKDAQLVVGEGGGVGDRQAHATQPHHEGPDQDRGPSRRGDRQPAHGQIIPRGRDESSGGPRPAPLT